MHISRHDNPRRRKRGPQKPMPKKKPPPNFDMEDVEITNKFDRTTEEFPKPAVEDAIESPEFKIDEKEASVVSANVTPCDSLDISNPPSVNSS